MRPRDSSRQHDPISQRLRRVANLSYMGIKPVKECDHVDSGRKENECDGEKGQQKTDLEIRNQKGPKVP